MSRIRRLELIERIEKERKSRVVAYVLSDLPGCEGSVGADAVEEMYRLLCELKPLERKSLDLFLFARQGDITVPWQMVGMVRELFDVFNVIIPHNAHGPATMIALGADTIIMGERGTLSPIGALVPGDSWWNGRDGEIKGLGVEDAKAVMSLLESFGRMREKQRIDAFLRIMDRVHPLLLGSMHKRVEQIRTDCLALLQKRKRRFGNRKNREIVKHLCSDSSSSHHYITRSEARRQIGLKQVRTEEALEPAFWELFTLYEQEFKALQPEKQHDPFDSDEKVFPNRRVGYLESTLRTSALVEDVMTVQTREITPGIRLDPQIVLPALQIGSELDQGDVWSFIEGWLQGNLPSLIDEALVRFRKSLPVSGCKWTSLNRRWVDA